jgi:hypothetical protein
VDGVGKRFEWRPRSRIEVRSIPNLRSIDMLLEDHLFDMHGGYPSSDRLPGAICVAPPC